MTRCSRCFRRCLFLVSWPWGRQVLSFRTAAMSRARWRVCQGCVDWVDAALFEPAPC